MKKFKITLTQHTPDPYTKSDGTLVDYTREDNIEGETADTEALSSLINLVTEMFKSVDIKLAVVDVDNEEE